MNAKVEVEESSGLDTVKWLVALLLVAAGIGGFYYFEEHSLLMRVLGLLAIAGVAIAVALQSSQGRRAWNFAADARTEVRKVVWPTRQETWQTTLIVFAMVLVMAFVLWLVDMGLMEIVRVATGQVG
ncbi:Protein translocase subunit SecE [hydrothermal vent metagenome]|uniref:Protein translocase subunit SecE n=1 Tax=hydrothermal vent metagenome TaxID=652676 RepID=A0A3B1BAL4_9ZZZZ